MPEKWTKRSRPPPSGVMNPKPFSSENHLTVPVPTDDPTCCSARGSRRTLFDRSVRPVPTGADAIAPAASRASAIDENPVWRCLSGERARGRGDLVAVPGRGMPRQLQRIAAVARDDVQVEVEDGLPGR